MNGVVFYEGPSQIDGSPIVGIATFGTKNEKTGDLVQTWILRADMHPMDAINSGNDASICGSCPLRGRIADIAEKTKKTNVFLDTTNKGRSCYVLVHTAPNQIYRSYKRGNYPLLDKENGKLMTGKGLRYGSYGDPVAIPMKSWNKLAKYCTGKSSPGYTHQWKDKKFARWSKRLMASTHNLQENELAHSMGWRTFRTVMDISDKGEREIICPASAEGGYKADCMTCGACNGRKSLEDMRHNVVIIAHGSGYKPQLMQPLMKNEN